MSTPGLINSYPFVSVLPQPYPINQISQSADMFQFPNHAHINCSPAVPFLNPRDLAAHLVSPIAYNYISDPDLVNGDKPAADNTLFIKLIMSGKEVGSIIGKRGDNIKRFREESLARINISDGNSPERTVTISGNCDQVHRATELLCNKLQEDAQKGTEKTQDSNSPILSIRLLIQPTQYAGIHGNGGSVMARLKEMTDVTMLIGNEFQAHSPERVLTISGTSQSISNCIHELCRVLTEMPCNTYIVPLSAYNGMQQTVPPTGMNKMTSSAIGETMTIPASSIPAHPIQNMYPQPFYPDQMSYPFGLPMSLIPLKMPNPLSPYLQKPPYDSLWKSSNSLPLSPPQIVSREFYVENEMIGCIIGRGGSSINEIRAISGAQIKISNCEDGKQDRKINICGPVDAVHTAQILINSRITWELLRWHL